MRSAPSTSVPLRRSASSPVSMRATGHVSVVPGVGGYTLTFLMDSRRPEAPEPETPHVIPSRPASFCSAAALPPSRPCGGGGAGAAATVPLRATDRAGTPLHTNIYSQMNFLRPV